MAQATMIDRTDTTHTIAGCCGTIAAPSLTEPQAEEYASWFKALADPTRVRILNLLARNDEPICVCEIVDHFALGQPTISHHLKILKETCFVQAERRGTFMYYRINQNCVAGFPDAASRIMGR
ncbi:MAG: metalloregulator ArsR/SmtB family transcription factor [Acetobacteraceae bacterium]